MINQNVLLGYPIEFKDICMLYPPKVKDVLGNLNFGKYNKLLTYAQEEIEDDYVENKLDLKNLPTPWQYLMANAYHNEEFKKVAKEAFLFFIKEPVTFLFEQNMILIGDIKTQTSVEKLRFLREEDYFDFQNEVRKLMNIPTVEPPDPTIDPRIKAMKAKARYRDKVKAKQNKNSGLVTSLSAIFCMGYGLNPLNIGELSYAAIPVLIYYYQAKEKYELDVQSALAGNKKAKPKYWIKDYEN